MFYAKNIEGLMELIKIMARDNTEPVDPEVGLQLFFQIGRPHFNAAVKHYFACGTSFFNFQETLEKAYFDKESEPSFGQINRKLAYNQESEDLDRILPFLKVKKFMLQVAEAANYQGMGLDYIISERTHTISIIDFNSYPGYKVCTHPQIKNMHERYLNELVLAKK